MMGVSVRSGDASVTAELAVAEIGPTVGAKCPWRSLGARPWRGPVRAAMAGALKVITAPMRLARRYAYFSNDQAA